MGGSGQRARRSLGPATDLTLRARWGRRRGAETTAQPTRRYELKAKLKKQNYFPCKRSDYEGTQFTLREGHCTQKDLLTFHPDKRNIY